MKYAIIAAGEGSRLQQEGIGVPKPLVKVGGEPLLDRLVRIFVSQGASEIDIICRPSPEMASHLTDLQKSVPVPVNIVVKATPSSMHSLFELSPLLADGPFVLTTVDTVFRETEFADYVSAFRRMLASGKADGLMGVSGYIDDEKPLYVETDASDRITAFLDVCGHPRFVSGGIYGLTPRSLLSLRRCVERGESRMRNFQRALIADGLRLRAFPFTKVLDIDHASDIQKAEQFLR